jgi:two-component system, cell cycle response regulator
MIDQGILLVGRIRSKRKKMIDALKALPTLQRFYEAETLRHGIGILSQEKVDLILYRPDHSLKQSKKDLSRLSFLEKDEIGRDIPILFIGGNESPSQKKEAFQTGAWDYIDSFHLEDIVTRSQVLLRMKAEQDKLKDRIRQLETLSSIDSLTGLYNRAYLKEFLQREVKRAGRERGQVFCMMMDIDDFKKINDQEGHLKGDQVLQQIGNSLRELLRDYDFAARYGGDEFTIVFSQRMEEKEVMNVAERIRKQISRQIFGKKGRRGIQLTVSMGISVFPLRGVETDEALLASADQALYSAKKRGKNQIVRYQSK